MFVLLTLALVAVVPVVLDALPLGPVGTVLAQVVRWVLLVALVVAALAVVYRLAPDRDAPRFAWVSTGSMVATVLWIVGSVAVQPVREQLRQLQQDLRRRSRASSC